MSKTFHLINSVISNNGLQISSGTYVFSTTYNANHSEFIMKNNAFYYNGG